ncbi:hypothetical protein I302_100099 [Kwoniella bestiolae CBS 10118]|uniref:Uncharacterized protein n=1 Tax=Kwoniella bestiolae CBS 10118 TaxID=1296100 RepID=A0A1B9G481_9TREE|nr:hypothetical protein I302_03473 [Kwoniella bestiolae CBS 10118]OCF25800.1 hypothetical protein I302_03473 [Kwoniella bestiolae CBS 10118]
MTLGFRTLFGKSHLPHQSCSPSAPSDAPLEVSGSTKSGIIPLPLSQSLAILTNISITDTTDTAHDGSTASSSSFHLPTILANVLSGYSLPPMEARTLKINKHNTHSVFANFLPRQVPAYKADLILLNQVEHLMIEDLEAARVLAEVLDPHYLRMHLAHSPDYCECFRLWIFAKVHTIIFGPALTSAIHTASPLDYLGIEKIFQVMGCVLRPSHLHIDAGDDGIPIISDVEEYRLKLQYELPERVQLLFMKWLLKSYTSRDFVLYMEELVKTVEEINIIFADCPFPRNRRCTCQDNFENTINWIFFDDLDYPHIEETLTGRRVNLVNLPHISGDMVCVDGIKQIKMKSLMRLHVDDRDREKTTIEDGIARCSGWIEHNLKIMKREEARTWL